jgi:hypothetical protein
VTTFEPAGTPLTARAVTLVYERVALKPELSFDVITPSARTFATDELEALKSRLPR